MIEPKRYTVTSALPYANGPLHAGHLAGAYLPADIYVRYLKSRGKEVLFICGTDEHGVAIPLRSRKEGLTPKEVVDKYYAQFKKTFGAFGIDFDIFSRTSLPIHHETASEFFKKFYENNLLEEKVSLQFYDAKEGVFLADRYIIGTCPKCNYEKAYGDQCEKCGSSLSPEQLINPRSALSDNTPELRETKHWYFPLDRFQTALEEYIENHSGDWKANVLGQCRSWLKEGLQARAITRDSDWGIPVPLEEAKGKVLYVWFEALIGYISATKDWAKQKEGRDWKPFWLKQEKTNDNAKLVHFIGKDNIVFHCIMFPAMLMADNNYILADSIPANEFLNLEGEKLSTSRNWAVWLDEYLEDFKDVKGSVDAMRYVLCATMPESKDNNFTWKDFQARVNNELVAILGNFVNRVLTFTYNNFEGKTPSFGYNFNKINYTNYNPTDLSQKRDDMDFCIKKFYFKEALNIVIDLARQGNCFFQDNEPWNLIKKDNKTTSYFIYNCLNLTGSLAIFLEPFLPETSKKIYYLLNLKPSKSDILYHRINIPACHQLNKPELLFDKIDNEMVNKQIQKLNRSI